MYVDREHLPSDSVCIGCGLCCDGSVVTHLAVRDESDLGLPLQALGVELLFAAEPPVFALPCPAVHEGRCTIHALHRPSACSQFECKLSSAVLKGDIAKSDARLIIAEALRLRDEVSQGIGQCADFADYLTNHFRPMPPSGV